MFNRRVNDQEQLADALKADCCSRRCMAYKSLDELRTARMQVASVSNQAALQQLVATMKGFSRTFDAATGRSHYQYTFAGHSVCSEAFALIHGYSRHIMKRARALLREGCDVAVSAHAFSNGLREAEQTKWMYNYLYQYYIVHCDTASADDNKDGKGHWYLPAYLNEKTVYDEMRMEWIEREKRGMAENELLRMESRDDACRVPVAEVRPAPSYKSFTEMNRKSFSHVVEPTKSTYGVCERCLTLGLARTEALKQAKTLADLAQVIVSIRAHRADFLKAREMMRERIEYALSHPHEVLYLGIDYTVDFDLPSHRPVAHMQSDGPMSVKTGGIINFSTATNYVFGHWAGSVSKGGNSVATLLWNVIRAAKRSDHPCAHARTLQIQMDGGSENSCHTFYSFCATLVEVGWFDVVELYRLPVGHTHSILDQRPRCWSPPNRRQHP